MENLRASCPATHRSGVLSTWVVALALRAFNSRVWTMGFVLLDGSKSAPDCTPAGRSGSVAGEFPFVTLTPGGC